MNDNDIELLIAGRALIDSYMEEISGLDDSDPVQSAQHTEATGTMMAGLAALGFSIFQAFIDFNEMMCLQALSGLSDGICDKCSGVRGIPACVQRYGKDACYYRTDIDSYKSAAARLNHVLKVLRAGRYTPDDDELNHSVCPKGHGWHITVADFNNLPFDIMWGEQWHY